MSKVLALIDLYSQLNLGLLSENRTQASITFLGRYAFVDIALSNLTNSNIDKVGLLIKSNANSIYKHIGNTNTYLANPRTGSINLLINEKGLTNPLYNTDFVNLKENNFILYDEAEYVILTNAMYFMKLNYKAVVDEHIKSGKEVTMVYKKVESGEGFENAEKVVVDRLGNLQKLYYDKSEDASSIYLDTMIINKGLLLSLLNDESLGDAATFRDVEKLLLKRLTNGIHMYEFKGFVRLFDSLEKYYKYSMEILNNEELFSEFFDDEEWKFSTTSHNSSPVIYGPKAKVQNSILANGSKIYGTVRNSILARDVIVEEGAEVEDSIIFTHCYIKKGTHVKGVIADKRVQFVHKLNVEGEEDKPLYIPRGAKI